MTSEQVQDALEARDLLELAGDLALTLHVTLDELTTHDGSRSSERIARARWLVWATLREMGFSYVEIGDLWGMHHTSVMHGVRRA